MLTSDGSSRRRATSTPPPREACLRRRRVAPVSVVVVSPEIGAPDHGHPGELARPRERHRRFKWPVDDKDRAYRLGSHFLSGLETMCSAYANSQTQSIPTWGDVAGAGSAMSKPAAGLQVRWAERNERKGWRVEFTVAGGRLQRDDPVASPDGRNARNLARTLKSGVLWITDDGEVPALGNDVLRWATVTRKVLQRGTRPPVSDRAESIIRQHAGAGPSRSMNEVLAGY